MRPSTALFLFLFALPAAAANLVITSAATDGRRVAVVWSDGAIIRGALVDATNQIVGDSIAIGEGSQPAVAFVNDTYFVVWADSTGVRFRRFAMDGTALDSEAAVVAGGSVRWLAIAAGDNGAAVAWFDDGYTLHAAWIDADGRVLIRSDSLYSYHVSPTSLMTAWNGTRFIVAWNQPQVTCSFCLNPSAPLAVFLDAQGFPATGVVTLPSFISAVAGGDGRFLVLSSGAGTSSYVVDDSGKATPVTQLWWKTYGPVAGLWDGSKFLARIGEYEITISGDNVPTGLGGSHPGIQILPLSTPPGALLLVGSRQVAVYASGHDVLVRMIGPSRHRPAA